MKKSTTQFTHKDQFECVNGLLPAVINGVVNGDRQTAAELAAKATEIWGEPVDADRIDHHFKCWAKKGKGIALVVHKDAEGRYFIPGAATQDKVTAKKCVK